MRDIMKEQASFSTADEWLRPPKSDGRLHHPSRVHNTASSVDGSEQLNVVELLLERHARGSQAGKTALIEGERSVSYSGLNGMVERASAALADEGVRAGDVIGFLTHDTLEAVAFLLATLRLGAIAVYCNPFLGTEECAALLEHAAPRLVLVGEGLHKTAAPAVKRLDAAWYELRERLERGGSRLPPTARVAAEAPAICLYSSGSTGQPKAILHSHRNIINTNLNYAAGVLNVTASDIIFSSSRLFFAYGFNSLHYALFSGATAVLAPPNPKPKLLIGLIQRWHPTVFFGVPTIYLLMLREEGEDCDLSSLRLCVSAGEPLPQDVFAAWRKRFGQAIIDGIGTTEVLSTFISNTSEDNQPGSTGRLVPGFEVNLVAEDGRLAAVDEVGTLWVRGNTVAEGYWRDPETTARVFQRGWFCTNDMFKRDAAGRFHYIGRANDMLKVGGCWVSPIAIEQTLRAHEAVHDCAVVGHRQCTGLIRPKALVVLEGGYAAGPEMTNRLKTFARLRLRPQEYPHFIEFMPELPKTASGKTQRHKLRQAPAPTPETGSSGPGEGAGSPAPTKAARDRSTMTMKPYPKTRLFNRLRFILDRRLTAANVIDKAAALHDDTPLIHFDVAPPYGDLGQNLTPHQLLGFANRFGALLTRHLGMARYDRVAVIKANHGDYVVMGLAIIRAGGITVPINGGVSEDIVARYLAYVSATILITDSAAYTRLRAKEAIPDTVRHILITDLSPGTPTATAGSRVVDLAAALDKINTSETCPPVGMVADDDVLICHTSGTTGIPKGVLHTSGSLVAGIKGMLKLLPPFRDGTTLSASPFNHFINHMQLMARLVAQVPTWMVGNDDPQFILELIDHQQIPVVFCFPHTYVAMCETGLDSHDLGSVRVWICGADSSHEAHIKQFVQRGALLRLFGRPLIRSMYVDSLGSSEVGFGALTRFILPYSWRFQRFVGKPDSAGPKVKIADERGRPLPPEQVGRLMVKGPTLFKGYWNAHDKLHGVVLDGWWWTGDVGYRDRAGRFYHLDRDVDVIRTAQGPVYSLPIEEELLKEPDVVEAVVIGADAHDGTQIPIALIQEQDGSQLDVERIREVVNARLPNGGFIARAILVERDTIPLGLTGKVLKRVLREAYRAMPAPAESTPKDAGGAAGYVPRPC